MFFDFLYEDFSGTWKRSNENIPPDQDGSFVRKKDIN
jgi:hypothetical protein